MLTLPIKKKWFDMIASGEKKEEYREIKEYYEIRLQNLFGAITIYPSSIFHIKANMSYCKARQYLRR